MNIFKRTHAIIRTDKTLKEYRDRFGYLYDRGRIISYTKKEYEYYFSNSQYGSPIYYRSNRIKEYWVINNVYYEVPKLTVTSSKKHVTKKKPVKKGELSEKRKISYDMMHYNGNKSSFWFILLAIALNIAMFIIVYRAVIGKSSDLGNVQLGLDLIINVVFMLVAFLAAEKTKRYSKEWGIISFVLGGIQVARIFWIPLSYYLNGGINSGEFSACVILQACGAACCIVAGVLTLIKYRIIQEHEPLIKKEGAKKDVRT